MVEFHLPPTMSKEYLDLIPTHKLKIQNYFEQNILLTYTLSYKLDKLWAVFVAKSKEEVEGFIKELPLSKYMTYEINDLMFHETSDIVIPTFSLN